MVDVFSTAMFVCRGKGAFETLGDESTSAIDNPLLYGQSDPEALDEKINVFAPRTHSIVSIAALKSKMNLNMCSACTHLGGDSLRTASVFIAAVIATATKATGTICDAWASIVVTITIIALVCPLIYHIYQAAIAK